VGKLNKEVRRHAAAEDGSTEVVSHNKVMNEKTDTQRRSESRRAGVLVRMSHEEREALHAVAAARGTAVSDLLREAVAPYLEPELQDA
jgi:hypothetical protein